MAIIAVDDTIILSRQAADYMGDPKRDRRVKTGFRLALEWLGVPLPDYIARKEAGRTDGARAITAAFNADHGIRDHSKHVRHSTVIRPADNGWQGPG